MKVVALLRVSTEDQTNGLDVQRADIAAWAEKRGAVVVAWHEERGVSGKLPIDKRTGLLAAINDIETLGAKALVAQKRDRISRDTLVTMLIEREVARYGAIVTTAVGGVDGNGPEEVFMRRIFDAVAELERAITAGRTKSALAVKKSRGERVGSVPFGKRENNGILVDDPREQACIAVAKSAASSGAGLREICRRLDEAGMRPRSGGLWHPNQIKRMLCNLT